MENPLLLKKPQDKKNTEGTEDCRGPQRRDDILGYGNE
jgi:hypothetical protein